MALAVSLVAQPIAVWAQDSPHSPTLYGQLGLNTVPSARMDQVGTVRAGVSTLDPYIHGYLGFQIAQPLYVSLRQTAESSTLTNDPRRLFPGVDFKLRLMKESAWRPELSIGMQSAFGHKRTSGEYIAASKRIDNFDLTAGLGWGRFGSAGHFANPLGTLLNHFEKDRALDGEDPVEPEDWFTGKEVGVFAGMEYFTPWDGVSLKADIGADRYEAEKASFGFNAPAPWTLSVNYAPAPWADVSLGMAGADKIFARLNLQDAFRNWPGRGAAKSPPPALLPGRPTAPFPPQNINTLKVEYGNADAAPSLLSLSAYEPTARQIGRAVRHLGNNTPGDVNAYRILPYHLGLRGPVITLMRRDFETALLQKQGSPQEIWRNASLDSGAENFTPTHSSFKSWNVNFTLDNDVSLSEVDTGILYRTALLVDVKRELGFNLTSGYQGRMNIRDNLHRLDDFRAESLLPVRSNVDDFTDRTFALDRSYISWIRNMSDSVYAGITTGYLEEMYGGLGGEILYRPFGKTYALGAEAWQVFKRDPRTALNLGFSGDSLLTGHVTGYYEVPDTGMTASLKLGRYLAEDVGGTLSLTHSFDNGARVEGFLTATDLADVDVFDSATHLYSGLRFSLPIGNIPYIGRGSSIKIDAAPIGRDAGQTIDVPLPLYDVTEPLSYRAITQSWTGILD